MRPRFSSIGLWLLVAVQVAIPASYYIWREAAEDDERFAWRMFSAVRLKRCSVDVFDGEPGDVRPIDMSLAVHASWMRSMGRGRERVIERFLATRCAVQGVQLAVLSRRCQWPSGRQLPGEQYRYDCASGALEVRR